MHDHVDLHCQIKSIVTSLMILTGLRILTNSTILTLLTLLAEENQSLLAMRKHDENLSNAAFPTAFPTSSSSTKAIMAESHKKRKRGLFFDNLQELLAAEPEDYAIAWKNLRERIEELDSGTTKAIPSVSHPYRSHYPLEKD